MAYGSTAGSGGSFRMPSYRRPTASGGGGSGGGGSLSFPEKGIER